MTPKTAATTEKHVRWRGKRRPQKWAQRWKLKKMALIPKQTRSSEARVYPNTSRDFVPGSLEAPAGEEFAVAVPRFPLLVGADEYLF